MPVVSTSSARVPWRTAWQRALYGEGGFYRTGAPAEHFATSAQGVPGGGEVLAAAVLALARRHRCTRVVDVGAGRGELLAHLRRLDTGLRLVGVDVGAPPARLDVDDWLVSPGGPDLPDGLTDLRDTLVLAHEWLDVVPCAVVQRDDTGVWRVVTVASDGTEALGPPLDGEDLAWAARWLDDEVGRAEVGRTRDLALADLVSRVRAGVVVAVDYGHTAAGRPREGTLTAFRGGREVTPVPDGSCDLTAHVAVDSLVHHVGSVAGAGAPVVLTQRQALDDLCPTPPDPDRQGLARRDPTAYLAGLARRAALGALRAPGGLGDFSWVVVPVPGEGRG